MIADVGFVGMPNAGKSTLLASSSNAHPEIANYPFTTLKPNLGMVSVGEEALLCADIPGLIEGAAEGKGLGDEFLRHVERTSVLIHLIDVYQDDIVGAYKTIQSELQQYSKELAKKPQVVVLNKIDGLDKDIIDDKISELRAVVPKNTEVMAISAKSKQNVRELFFATTKLVDRQKKKQQTLRQKVLPVLRFKPKDDDWQVQPVSDGFVVTGKKIEKFAERTDFANPHGIQRLRDIMYKMGIMKALEKQGIEAGQQIYIGQTKQQKIEF